MPLLPAAALLASLTPHPGPALVRVDAPTAAAACVRDGDQVTVTGRFGIGSITPAADPQHKAQTYLTITFDPAVCVITSDAPDGTQVAHAAYLAARPPLKSMMGVPQTLTGSIEKGSEGTNEAFSFVTY